MDSITEESGKRAGKNESKIDNKTRSKDLQIRQIQQRFKSTLNENVDDTDKNNYKDDISGDVRYLEQLSSSKPIPISHKERTYSLVRPESTPDDSHVTFTRIPSFSGRRINVTFLRNLAANPHADDDDDSPSLKDATDISPFDSGEVLVTDMLSNRIVLYDSQGHSKVTFSVELGSEPWASCMTPSGSMAVTLRRQGCVALWSTSGEPMIEFGQTSLQTPAGLRCDKLGRFIITDETNNAVFIFTKHGKFLTELSMSGDHCSPKVSSCPASPAAYTYSSTPFNRPRYVCVTPDGDYVICDSANHCVKLFDKAGRFITAFGGYGRQDGQLKFPYGVTCDQGGNIYVADHYNSRVSLFSKHGSFIEHLLTSEKDHITRPKALAVMNYLLYVSHGDFRADKISVYRLTKTHERRVINVEL